MTYDPVEAARLTALGVIDGRTMIPAGLVDPPADHPWWAEVVDRLERRHPLDSPTWAVLERVTPDNPFFGVVASHLMKMERTGG